MIEIPILIRLLTVVTGNPADLIATDIDMPETEYNVTVLFVDSKQNEDLRSLVVRQLISLAFFSLVQSLAQPLAFTASL